MITFPRDVPDKVTVDGETVEYRPSDLSTGQHPNHFKEAIIETHCSNCLKKQTLKYSESFPARITFVCGECDKTNKIADIHRDGKNIARFREIDRNLRKRVRKRESYVAGLNYSSRRGTNTNRILKEHDRARRLRGPLLLLGLIIGVLGNILLLANFMYAFSVIFTIFTVLVLGFLARIVTGWVKPEIPQDPYLDLKYRSFVKGLRSEQNVSEDFRIDEDGEDEDKNVEYSTC